MRKGPKWGLFSEKLFLLCCLVVWPLCESRTNHALHILKSELVLPRDLHELGSNFLYSLRRLFVLSHVVVLPGNRPEYPALFSLHGTPSGGRFRRRITAAITRSSGRPESQGPSRSVRSESSGP